MLATGQRPERLLPAENLVEVVIEACGYAVDACDC